MRLQILLTAIVQVAVVGSLREVTGYLGDTVTLPSGADPSWNLSKIEWSVFSNNTWIATYREGKLNIERFHLYKGRLNLNTTSGDLMIHNLNPTDAIEYSVELISTDGQTNVKKISLTVTERLKPPKIEIRESEGGCLKELHCSSPGKGVNISWRVDPPNATVFYTSDPAVLAAFLGTTENNVKFTCTASNHMENTTTNIIPRCNDKKVRCSQQHKQQSESRCTYAPLFFLGFFLGGTLAAILTYCFREQIKAAWDFIKAKLFPSESAR